MKDTFAWLSAFAILGLSGMLISQPIGFEVRLAISCLAVFLSEALAGRWFGFIAAFLPAFGLINDASGTWLLVLPTLIASLLGCLIIKQTKPNIFTIVARGVIFALPAFALQIISDRLKSNIDLPGGASYALLQAIIGFGAIILGALIIAYRRSFSLYS